MTPAGLLGTSYPALVGTREEQLAEILFTRETEWLARNRQLDMPKGDALEDAMAAIAEHAGDIGTERAESICKLLTNVANAWTWPEPDEED